MNRIMGMLAAVIVLAAVGGALAFKANNYNNLKFCVDGPQQGICMTLIQNSTFVQGPNPVWYTPVTNGFLNNASCTTVTCPKRGVPVPEQ